MPKITDTEHPDGWKVLPDGTLEQVARMKTVTGGQGKSSESRMNVNAQSHPPRRRPAEGGRK